MILVLVTYVIRLFNIQLRNEEYKTLAENNAYYTKTVYPARGHMYDRNGKLLVYNQPSYDITFIPREAMNVDTTELCNALGMTLEEFYERMERIKNRKLNPGYSSYTEQDFVTQLSGEEFARF